MKIVLAGNPNSGKSTLFNRLTGARQKVGNWPGVTVEKKTGQLTQPGLSSMEVIDLPGLYSLDQIEPGQDEQIAADYLLTEAEEPKLILNVIDASNLNRNLVLTSQLVELGLPMIAVVNMVDVAEQKGVDIDWDLLATRLQVPVVPVIGSTGKGIDTLKQEINLLAAANDDLADSKQEAAEHCLFGGEEDHIVSRTTRRYHIVRDLTDGVVEMVPGHSNWSENIDRVVLNRWLGIPIFLLMMYLMFTFAVNLGAVFIDFFDILFGAIFVDGVSKLLQLVGVPMWLDVIIATGIGGGIQLVATFIPVIGFLYLCLSILEDSGYLSRAAFVIDRLMAKVGLPGNAFVPLVVGFGCNVPAVMAARTMNRESDRLLTIIMAPFMSCGARLTVYALFAAAFFPRNGQNVVFLLYLLGIVVAVFSGWIFRKQVFASHASPSFIEMPAYHMPVWRNIFITSWHRLRGFILRAGKTIVIVVTMLSFLNSIGTDGSFGNENSKRSVLSVIGQSITPLFKPMGIEQENWPATVGIFTGIFAKEAIVGTMDALYQGEDDEEEESLGIADATASALMSIQENLAGLTNALFDPLGLQVVASSDTAQQESGVGDSTLTKMAGLFHGEIGAFCYLVMILLYTPCVAVLGAIKREAGARWMWVVVAWTSFLAYAIASSLYQIAFWADQPLFASLWIAGCIAAWMLFVLWLKRLGKDMAASDVFVIKEIIDPAKIS
ncbi:MAG: ferrous iron transport protein B [Oceanicoccus sp.]